MTYSSSRNSTGGPPLSGSIDSLKHQQNLNNNLSGKDNNRKMQGLVFGTGEGSGRGTHRSGQQQDVFTIILQQTEEEDEGDVQVDEHEGGVSQIASNPRTANFKNQEEVKRR